MKVLTAALFALVSVLPGAAAPARAEGRIIKIAVRLDNAKGFSADSLSLFVLHSKKKEEGWQQLGSLKPDADGNFIVAVPDGGWLSLELSTSDPTVRREKAEDNERDFYTAKNDQKVVVLRDEFRIDENAQAPLVKQYKLHRGAAFTPCLPNNIKKGSIQFKKLLDADEQGINVWDFSDADVVSGAVIGGLLPGQWHVRYFDDDDIEWNSQVVDLSRGQLLRQSCKDGRDVTKQARR